MMRILTVPEIYPIDSPEARNELACKIAQMLWRGNVENCGEYIGEGYIIIGDIEKLAKDVYETDYVAFKNTAFLNLGKKAYDSVKRLNESISVCQNCNKPKKGGLTPRDDELWCEKCIETTESATGKEL